MGEVRQIGPILLAQYIVDFLNKKGQAVSHLKLQKLIYYIDAWHYVYFDMPMIKEDFQAWMHGPVVREVWDEFKDKSVLFTPIEISSEGVDLSTYLMPDQIELINDVLEEYGNKTAYYLECLTHSEEPWRMARRGYAPTERCEVIMSKNFMKEFYGQKLYGKDNTETT